MKRVACLLVCLFTGAANAGVISFSFTDDPSAYAFGRTHVSGTVTGLLTFSEDLTIDGIYLPDAIEFTSDLSWLGATDSSINMSTAWMHSSSAGFTFNSGNVADASYGINYNDSGVGQLQFRLNSSFSGMNILHWNGGTGPMNAIANTDGFYGSAYSPSVSVPEPASLILLGIGLAGLGFARRKQNA